MKKRMMTLDLDDTDANADWIKHAHDDSGVKHPDVTVKLVGQDGNAFMILGLVQKALRKAGYGSECAEFIAEATAGNHDDLLCTAMRWVNVE